MSARVHLTPEEEEALGRLLGRLLVYLFRIYGSWQGWLVTLGLFALGWLIGWKVMELREKASPEEDE